VSRGGSASRLIGLDVGDRRVGVAVSDAAGLGVRPLATFRRVSIEADAGLVARLASEHGVTELVVGLPLEGDGREGEQAGRTRAWGNAIAERTGLRLAWRDERFTTQAAEAGQPRLRRERATGQPTRAAIRRRRASVDREAAARILQAELDARAAASASGGAGSSSAVPRNSTGDAG
jgi:putative holliday junction resolvase